MKVRNQALKCAKPIFHLIQLYREKIEGVNCWLLNMHALWVKSYIVNFFRKKEIINVNAGIEFLSVIKCLMQSANL